MEKSSRLSRIGQHGVVRALATLWSILISFVVVVSFLAIVYFVGGREFYLWVNSVTWQETQCEILKATYDRQEKGEVGSSSVKISFKTIVSYRFKTDFGSYRGNRYNFSLWRTSLRSVRNDFKYLSSSKHLPCYYNPRQPEQSVISRQFQTDFLWMLIPLLSLGPFAYIALTNILSKFRRPKKVKTFLPKRRL